MNAQHTQICFLEQKTNHRNKRTQTLAPRTLRRPAAMRSESGGAGWHAHIWSPLFSLRAARFTPCNVASIVLSRSLMPTTCDYPFHGDYVEAVSKVHFWNFFSHATNCRIMPSEGTLHKEQQACPPTLAPMTTSGVRSAMQKKKRWCSTSSWVKLSKVLVKTLRDKFRTLDVMASAPFCWKLWQKRVCRLSTST